MSTIRVSLWSARRLAYGLLPLLSALEKEGVETAPLLKRVGIAEFGVYDPRYTIAIEQELSLLEHSFAAVDAESFGLVIGQRYDLRSFSTLGLAMQACQNLAEVLQLVAQFPQLAWGVSEVLVEFQQTAIELCFQPHPLLGGLTQELVERDMLCALRLLGQCAGQKMVPLQLDLPRSASSPSQQQRYLQSFGLQPRWSQSGHRMRFAVELLNQPLPQADARIGRFYRAQCQQMVEAMSQPFRFAQSVRERLRQMSPIPDLPELAEQMWLSPRTLQRRLRAEQTTFSQLLQAVRLERACARLQDRSVSLAQLAQELGFSDEVAFSHAFHAWTGRAPRSWSQENKEAF